MNKIPAGIIGSLLLTVAHAQHGVSQDLASMSSGLADEENPGLIECGKGTRPSKVGKIESEDGLVWTVPAATRFTTAPHATDLYNACSGVKSGSIADVDMDAVPVVDAGGDEVFTVYIFADNYFEFFANGQLIAVDAVPFTPFNSSVLKFRASRPVTLAIMGVDWEENLGLGSEAGRGKKFHPGDAGMVAMVIDEDGNVVAITDGTWKAQTFYTSPISDRGCLVPSDNGRDSSACSTSGGNSANGLSAAFWPMPKGWEQPGFDAADWPDAVTFSNATVGVNNKPAYTNFTDLFDNQKDDAQFIWSSNLVLDNLVLMRTQIP